MEKFTKDELLRYSRHFMLEDICVDGQFKFKTAKILVIGAGGLGCPVIQYLAASGIGALGIIDFDKIEIHNLHRQILYGTDDIGQAKVQIAAGRVKASNPHVNCIAYETKLDETNAEQIIDQFDLVIDGSDNFATRYLVNDVCMALNKPLVYGSILNYEAQLAVFNYKNGKNLRDIYPDAPHPDEAPSCSLNGVVGVVPGLLGLYMANVALQIVLGTYEQKGLMIFDFKNFDILKLNF
ncbi:HesA/MoeB/ThiF family protein [Pedobacter punctiformis]|uniref:HesA/MoeB/ThiF family protein n=1 Tax=Pedobacter punctiformis TaxID=3004097 RepID=A0ABT4L7Q4_9SPHI|nr:HesA/MoeB/ThiF family protein [Pedobacter sp. HCMS5-2]MCZ4243954.1 HesA/MoeB/ThiF family protein [Pedobacter sp. HCMS5-2]